LILSFANVEAFARFDAADPNASRCVDEDLNRVWHDSVLFGPGDSLELRRARQLQPFVDRADYLFDIHSMQDDCRPLMVCGLLDKGAAFARELGMPGDLLIDTGHPSGLRMRDRGGFGDPQSSKNALLIECGQHWAQSSADVAVDGLIRFLRLTGMVDAAWAEARLRLPLPAEQRLIRVDRAVIALSADFHFLQPVHGLDVIAKAGTAFAQDGETVFLTSYDNTVLVMPSTKHGKPGNTMVRLGRLD
jgi:predicted deacylase